MNKIVSVLLLSILIYISSAQIPIDGKCPSFECCKTPLNISSQTNFNGNWYLYGGKTLFYLAGSKCVRYNLTMLPNNGVHINVTHYNTITEESSSFEIHGNFSLKNRIDYLVSKTKFPMSLDIIEYNSKFIIEIACFDCGHYSHEGAGIYVYVLTRSKNPSAAVINAINAKLDECQISRESIELHDQSSCGTLVGGC